MHDADLIREYVRNGSESAFAELVKRHVDLVFSAARRQLGDAHLAEEVTQSVFCLLARKAPGLTGCVSLSGWLYRTTGFIAAKALRTELRRRRHEQEAVQMHVSESSADELWLQVAPHLDSAMQQLGETDRHAVLLRYFERKPLRDVGEALGVSEAAAKMRVGRALDRLRALLAKRGATVSATALGALLSAQAVQGAPATLAPSILAAASSITAGATFATGLSTTLAIMAKLNLKTVGLAAVALALVGGGTLLLRSQAGLEEAGSITTPQNAKFVAGKLALDPRATNLESAPVLESADSSALERAKAQLRAALQIPPPKPGEHWSYPSDEVVKALEAFGPERKEAFGILMDAFASANEEAKQQAVSAMGRVGCPEGPGCPGEPAPEVRGFLFNLLLADDQPFPRSLSPLALNSFQKLGVETKDLPGLALLLAKTENPMLRRYLPEAVADAVRRDPAAFGPYLGDFRALMQSDDPDLRFRAARAISQSDAGTNPQVLDELVAGLKTRDRAGEALESLKKLGSKAKPVLADVIEYANQHGGLPQTAAFNTIGAIDSELRNEMPDVDLALKKSELFKNWAEKQKSNQWTVDDLHTVLATPGFVSSLVDPESPDPDRNLKTMLEAVGGSAKELLPELKQAMFGLSDPQRDELSKIISSIDLSATIQHFDSSMINNIVATVAEASQIQTLTEIPANGPTKPAGKNYRVTVEYPTQVDEQANEILFDLTSNSLSWKSGEEILSAANKLKAASPKLYALFVKTAIQQDPSFAKLFSVLP
jgi:RNA polymerase sigma factor (sigma-70 family)